MNLIKNLNNIQLQELLPEIKEEQTISLSAGIFKGNTSSTYFINVNNTYFTYQSKTKRDQDFELLDSGDLF